MATPRRKAQKATPAQNKALKGVRVVIVESRYYEDVAAELLAGAKRALEEAGVAYDIFEASGALEIPLVIAIAFDAGKAARKPYDGAVALGCVIRGETSHYDIVAGESAHALMQLSLTHRLPIGNAILTVDTDAQAQRRASREKDDKGGGAARAALSLIALKHQLGSKKR
jgi:6,7-dimethyl-8-ribityllumazine synthase